MKFNASVEKTLSTVYETRGQLITLPERGHCKDYYHITHVYDFYQQVVTALLLISFLLYGILLSEHKPTKYRNRDKVLKLHHERLRAVPSLQGVRS